MSGLFCPDHAHRFPDSLLLYDGTNEWESADGFAALTKKVETVISPTWLAQDPATHVGYAYDGTLHRSSGGTWLTDVEADYASNGNHAIVDNSGNLYAYGGNGIYQSHRNADGSCALHNASVCWAQISTQSNERDGGGWLNLYAGVLAPLKLTFSTDAGVTWKAMGRPRCRIRSIGTIVIDPAAVRRSPVGDRRYRSYLHAERRAARRGSTGIINAGKAVRFIPPR